MAQYGNFLACNVYDDGRRKVAFECRADNLEDAKRKLNESQVWYLCPSINPRVHGPITWYQERFNDDGSRDWELMSPAVATMRSWHHEKKDAGPYYDAGGVQFTHDPKRAGSFQPFRYKQLYSRNGRRLKLCDTPTVFCRSRKDAEYLIKLWGHVSSPLDRSVPLTWRYALCD